MSIDSSMTKSSTIDNNYFEHSKSFSPIVKQLQTPKKFFEKKSSQSRIFYELAESYLANVESSKSNSQGQNKTILSDLKVLTYIEIERFASYLPSPHTRHPLSSLTEYLQDEMKNRTNLKNIFTDEKTKKLVKALSDEQIDELIFNPTTKKIMKLCAKNLLIGSELSFLHKVAAFKTIKDPRVLIDKAPEILTTYLPKEEPSAPSIEEPSAPSKEASEVINRTTEKPKLKKTLSVLNTTLSEQTKIIMNLRESIKKNPDKIDSNFFDSLEKVISHSLQYLIEKNWNSYIGNATPLRELLERLL
jgi:hypothetical protein